MSMGPATSSGNLTISAQVTVRPSFIYGFELNPPSTGYATLSIYDGTDNTGLLVATGNCAAGQNTLTLSYLVPRILNKGLYCQLTGTTTYVVAYSLS